MRLPYQPDLSDAELFAFHSPHMRSRRLFAEVLGTFLLVLVAAGAGMVDARYPGSVPLQNAAMAASLIVFVLILALGRISGTHINPVVTIGFALRNVFPWTRVPGYVIAQMAGASLAVVLLRAALGDVGDLGALHAGAGVTAGGVVVCEAILTFGLLTTILSVVNGGMNVGSVAAFAIAAYFGAAILIGGPIDGAGMNPARTLAPGIISGDLSGQWPWVVGPVIGMLAAVVVARVLRGAGGRDAQGPAMAQGEIEEVLRATGVIGPENEPEPKRR